MIPLPPLALYLHIPFCVHKCPYCDFSSEALTEMPETAYVDALMAEMRLWRRHQAEDGRALIAIYLGGGTPSLLGGVSMARILGAVRDLWPLAPGCEISMEANPESVTDERLEGWRRAGVNRISLGLQALDEGRLVLLERPHDLVAARRALAAVKAAGFQRFGLDLIHSTPGHDLEVWRDELAEALAVQPDHLSCYGLSLEPETPFYQRQQAGRLILPDEEQQRELFQETRRILDAAGYAPYEISNFAPLEGRCLHNLNYWRFGDYLGFGAAAHGKLTDGRGRVRRYHHADRAEAYMETLEAGDIPWREMPLEPLEAASECVVMGLRLQEGMCRGTYAALAGEDLLQRCGDAVIRFREMGLLELDETHIRLTPEGVLLADGVMAEFLV